MAPSWRLDDRCRLPAPRGRSWSVARPGRGTVRYESRSPITLQTFCLARDPRRNVESCQHFSKIKYRVPLFLARIISKQGKAAAGKWGLFQTDSNSWEKIKSLFRARTRQTIALFIRDSRLSRLSCFVTNFLPSHFSAEPAAVSAVVSLSEEDVAADSRRFEVN